jgi:hypothetical protein
MNRTDRYHQGPKCYNKNTIAINVKQVLQQKYNSNKDLVVKDQGDKVTRSEMTHGPHHSPELPLAYILA